MTIQEAIASAVAGENLTAQQTREVFDGIMSGSATPAQIAALLVALRMKGETIEEITGAALVMREKVTRIMPASSEFLVDTCGTGGDRSGTFNISTAAALVAAGAGARVAKHGNRSVSSPCGSADVLEALGVNITIGAGVMKQCLDETGICFLFAPAFHPAMKHAIGPRREMGVRTVFNILGPLTNPAYAPAQLMGVYSPNLVAPLAAVLRNLGSRRAFVVNSADGLDEISTVAPTHVAELAGDEVRTYDVAAEHYGLPRARHEDLAGGAAQENAAIIREILDGKKGPRRDITVLNAAFALAAAGRAATPNDGIRLAAEALDSGAAREKLQRLVELTIAK